MDRAALSALRKMGNVVLISVFFCVTIKSSLHAQPGSEGIYFVDSSTKVPVPDVLVQSADHKYSAYTNENGFLGFNNTIAVPDTIIVTCAGFWSKTVVLSQLPGKLSFLVISLVPKVWTMQEVTVVSMAASGTYKAISEFDIHLRPLINSQEVLRMIPGLFIGQHAGGGKAEQIFVRGFDVDHGTDINISVDGMPVNMVSHAHGQGYSDLHFVIPELIDKVNFNKGPYFADKGNFTTAGDVEFKTKEYLPKNILKIEGGTFSTFRAVAAINLINSKEAEIRNQSLYLAGEASFTNGYFENPQHFNRFNGTLKYHKSIGRNSILTAAFNAFSSKWNASGQIPERAVDSGIIGFYGAVDPTEGGKTARYNVNAGLLTNLSNGRSFSQQFFYSRYTFELYSNFTFYKNDPINGDQVRQKEGRSIVGYNNVYQWIFLAGNIKAESRVGMQVRYDAINNNELTRTKNRTTNTAPLMSGDIDELNAGVYLSERLWLSNRLDLTAAVRIDYFSNRYNDKLNVIANSTNNAIVSPKLRLNYRIHKNATLYLNAGKGFHSNDTRVAVQKDRKKVLPEAYGTDVGAITSVGKRLLLQSALWYLWMDQEFIYVGDEGVVEPAGKTRRLGVDFLARYTIIKNLYADADFSIADAHLQGVAKGMGYLPLAPRFTCVAGLAYKKASGINGSIRYRQMADRPANTTNSVMATGYGIADATINYTRKRWEAGLSIQNLFNSRWKETQFDTESRLQYESMPVSGIHFTAGTPLSAKGSLVIFF